MKKCIKCKIEKDESNFSKNSRQKDGLFYYCKDCAHKFSKVSSKKYYEANKKILVLKTAEYQKKNALKVNQKNRNWKHKNKEKVSLYNKISIYKRRLIQKDTDITSIWLEELKKNTKNCPICDCELNDILYDSKQYNLDHIIPLSMNGRHYKENVKFICRKCNLLKSSK